MAGFFGFFDYTKPGPGVPKDAPPKRRIIVFFEVFSRKFWRLIRLNMIYAISCLPLLAAWVIGLLAFADGKTSLGEFAFLLMIGYAINIFTIGPATAGFTYVLRNFSREEHAWVWSDFKEHALKNYKQAFIVSLIDLVVAVVMYVNLQFYTQLAAQNFYYGILKYIVLGMLILYIIMHFYIYQLMVTFQLTIKQIFKNAFIFTMLKLPRNFGMLVLCIIVLCAFYYYYIVGILLTPFLVLSTIGFMINFYVYPTLKKYMIDKVEEMENKTEETENHDLEQGSDDVTA